MSKNSNLQDFSIELPKDAEKQTATGINLQGSHGAIIRRVDIYGFSDGIDARKSKYAVIEDANIIVTTEDKFVTALGKCFPQLNIFQLMNAKSILKKFNNDPIKQKLGLFEIAKNMVHGSKFVQKAHELYEKFQS